MGKNGGEEASSTVELGKFTSGAGAFALIRILMPPFWRV